MRLYPVTEPFAKVSWDVVEFFPAYNRARYMQHFVCHATNYHKVYILTSKKQIPRNCRNFVAWIKRQFGIDTKIYQSDNDTALGNEHQTWVEEVGLEEARSAVDTPAQNGKAERAGG
jgi:hypothetical protein